MASFLAGPRSLSEISARERRLIALLLLVAAVAAAWLLLLSPLIDGFADRAAKREALAREYARGEAQVAALPRLARVAERSKARMADYLIVARSADRAGLILEDRLRTVLDAAGGAYRGSEHGEDRPGEAPAATPASGPAARPAEPVAIDVYSAHPRVLARIDGRMGRGELVRFLDLLQSSPPWLVVESVAIGNEGAVDLGKDPDLDVRVEASMAYVAR